MRANGADGATEVCLLLTSELVTNALLYARSDVVLRVLIDSTMVRISVHDDSLVPPVPRPSQTEDTSGRGLALVKGLANDWGVTLNGQGKEVWFEVPL